jgi:hypothetical protein
MCDHQTDGKQTSLWKPEMVDMREASCDPNPLCSEIFAPRHVEPYETFTAPQECIFEDLCTSFKVLKPYNTSDDYFLDLARVKPLPSPSRTEEYFLLHEPRIISVLEFACNTPLPDISSDEESFSVAPSPQRRLSLIEPLPE